MERLESEQSLPAHANLYLTGVAELDEDELRALFASFGPVESIRLQRNTRLPAKAYAFVRLDSISSAAAAARALDGLVLPSGAVLHVKAADADAGERKPAAAQAAAPSPSL